MRISPAEARQKVLCDEAMLICAYENEESFKKARLAGAISLKEFRRGATSLPREREIIFYCG